MKLHREPEGDAALAAMTPGPWSSDGSTVWYPGMGAVACTRMPIMTCRKCDSDEQLMPLMPSGGTLAPIANIHEAAANARAIARLPELLSAAEQLIVELDAIGAHPEWSTALRAAVDRARGR